MQRFSVFVVLAIAALLVAVASSAAVVAVDHSDAAVKTQLDTVVRQDSEEDAEASESPDSEDDDEVCFPASATVTLESGAVVRMDDLTVGDRVMVKDGVFSDVFMFTHKLADVQSNFVKVTVDGGAELLLTPGHYMYVNGALAAAKTIVAGDSVEKADGDLTTVKDVTMVTDKGLYNPQTVDGDIIVNGIRASTYTTTFEPTFAHAALAPVRWLYANFGFSTAALDAGAGILAKAVPSGAAAY